MKTISVDSKQTITVTVEFTEDDLLYLRNLTQNCVTGSETVTQSEVRASIFRFANSLLDNHFKD